MNSPTKPLLIAALVAASFLVFAGPGRAAASPREGVGRYASVNGLKMYYEVHGKGRPLVLLHGAYSSIDVEYRKMIPVFAKTRQVIAIEQQGHGHTGDIDRPITYEQMADDTAALLQQLKIERADFYGYSMGGAVALQVAKRHPGLVRKFVASGGTAFRPEGLYPELLALFDTITPEAFVGSPFYNAYLKASPDPKQWPAIVAKLKALDQSWKGWPPEEIQSIQAPTLLIIGDSDIVRPEHVVELFRLMGGGVAGDLHGLPRSQLAVLPGTTHVGVLERSDWLVPMVLSFLDAPDPQPAAAK